MDLPWHAPPKPRQQLYSLTTKAPVLAARLFRDWHEERPEFSSSLIRDFQHLFRALPRQVLRLGHRAIGQRVLVDVEAGAQVRVLLHRSFGAKISQRLGEGQGRVVEREG